MPSHRLLLGALFVLVPLMVVVVLLVIPVMPNNTLWPLGIGIGIFLIFGFAAWLAASFRSSSATSSLTRPLSSRTESVRSGRGRNID
jgi:hypothetical protein